MAGNEFGQRRLLSLRKERQVALLGSTALVLFSCATANAQELIEDSVSGSNNGVVVVNGTEERSDQIIRNTTSSWGNAVFVAPNGNLTGNNLEVETQGTSNTSGSLSAGFRAAAGSTLDLTGGTISATGSRYTRGILGYEGASITTDGTAISTLGANSHGVHVFEGATALIQGGTISTEGSDSFGVSSQNVDSTVTVQSVDIVTNGINGFGAFASGGGLVEFNGGSIETSGLRGHGAVAGEDSSIVLDGTSIQTSGERAWGLVADQANASITATGVDIETHGFHAYGAYASASGPDAANIVLEGGSITTANSDGEFVRGPEARGYGLFAQGSGASITATGTEISTRGQRSYGAHATGGASLNLNDLSITTNGFMGYGIYALDAGTEVNLSNVNVTTNGQVGDAVMALDGSRVEIDGGTFTVNGERNPNSPGEVASGFIAGGLPSTGDSIINARGVTIVTDGAASRGVRSGVYDGTYYLTGQISLTDSNVTVNGADAIAAEVAYGSSLSTTRTGLNSIQGVGVSILGNADLSVLDTAITAGQQTFVSTLNAADQSQTIDFLGGSVATQNNGTLLQVNRSGGGANGDVFLTLGAGSVSSGDIIDEDADFAAGGGTDVTLEEGAEWTGQVHGIRNFVGFQQGEVTFEGEANIQGNLTGNGTSYLFSEQGGQIGGDVILNNSSRTTGGTIDSRIFVGGDVTVDETSILGGNWDIAGDLTNAGTLSPGNSIGRVSVGGDLLLAPTSIYEVDIDASGDSDLIDVSGTATLDGSVTVSALGGFLVGSPYTILTAGTRIGEFDDDVAFAQESAFLDASLSYGPSSVFLTIGRNDVDFASVAETPNQAAVAEAIDQLPLSNELASAVALGTTEDATVAFDQVSGEIYASVPTALIEDSRHIRNAANDRIRAAFGDVGTSVTPVLAYGPDGPALAPADGDHLGMSAWGTAYGSWGSTDGDGNAASIDRSTGGVILGADALVTDQVRLGLLAGYSRSSVDLDARASSADIDSYHLGLYGGTQWQMPEGTLSLRGGLAYSWHDIETARSVGFTGFTDGLSADYDASTFQAFGELGYGIETDVARFEPFVNLAHVEVRTGSFNEAGGAAALSGDSGSNGITFTTLGVRAETELALGEVNGRLNGTIGWRHAFGDVTPESTHAFDGSDAFTISGTPIGQDALVLEAGLDLDLTPDTTLGLSYQGQLASDAQDHGFKANLAINF